jgi:hypothetical protein
MEDLGLGPAVPESGNTDIWEPTASQHNSYRKREITSFPFKRAISEVRNYN